MRLQRTDRRVGLGVGMQLSIGAREKMKKAVWSIGAWALEAREEERESAFHFISSSVCWRQLKTE